jgi:spore coat polysaccharide biosynthesis predicted glycosyltransferase SpsG/predicted TPR repeat methyltransferase
VTHTILFCADARPAAGGGHVQRCAAVAESIAAETDRFLVELLLLGWTGSELPAMMPRVSVRAAGLDEVLAEPALILAAGVPALLVLDAYPLLLDGWLRRFRARQPILPLIAFDDGLPNALQGVLGRVRAGLAAEAVVLDVLAGRFDAGGSAFIPLRSEAVRRSGALPPLTPCPTILIALGAADEERHAERIAGALSATQLDATVLTIHGPLADPERVASSCPDARFTALHAPPDFLDRMAAASLVVTGIGNTCHEALYQGVPVACVALAQEQVPAGKALERSGCGTFLGFIHERSEGELAAGINRCVRHLDELRANAVRGRSLVDGKGAERVARFLKDVVRAYHRDRFPAADVAAEFDRAAASGLEEHQKVGWGSAESMLNRIRLAREKIEWAAVDSWVDVGVGTGRFLAEVEEATRIRCFVGVDLSAEMLKVAAARACSTPAVAFQHQSFAEQVPGEPFSLVTALGVLQLCGLSLEHAVARLGAMAAVGGQVFLTTKNADWRRFQHAGFRPEPGHHWFRPNRLLRACSWAGLEVLEVGSFDPAQNLTSSDLSAHHSVWVLARKAGHDR